VNVQAPAGARIVLLKDGTEIRQVVGTRLEHSAPEEPGVYRVEARLPDAPGIPPVPWIVSNPIYVTPPGGQHEVSGAAASAPVVRESLVRYDDGPAEEWRIEASARSLGRVDIVSGAGGGEQLLFRYALGGTRSERPFVALVMPAGPDLATYDRLTFTARASRPMRVSVQVRAPEVSGGADRRRQKSVFVDTMPRELTVTFDEMTPQGPVDLDTPALRDVDSVLFVVDTVNTPVGGNGQLWIDLVKYER
jgi:hypothetical protein